MFARTCRGSKSAAALLLSPPTLSSSQKTRKISSVAAYSVTSDFQRNRRTISPNCPVAMSSSATSTNKAGGNKSSQLSTAKVGVELGEEDVLFGKFVIPTESIFYRSSASSIAFVNLRPIVPGHVLVIPERIVPVMSDLSEDEYLDLWKTVRLVQGMLKRHFTNCDAFNVAVQDGFAAGQSVPHAHVHILPREEGDYENNDDIYEDLQEWAPRQPEKYDRKFPQLEVLKDSERRDRTPQEMAEEAQAYRNTFQNS